MKQPCTKMCIPEYSFSFFSPSLSCFWAKRALENPDLRFAVNFPVRAAYLVNLYSLSDSLFGFDLCDVQPPYDRLFEPAVVVIKSVHMVWPGKREKITKQEHYFTQRTLMCNKRVKDIKKK